MKPNKIYIIIIIILTGTNIVLANLYIRKNFKNPISNNQNIENNIEPTEQNTNESVYTEVGYANLVGRISSITYKNGKVEANFELLENFQSNDMTEQALLIDGKCTLETIENNKCSESFFYYRPTKKYLTFTLDNNIILRVFPTGQSYDYTPDDTGMIQIPLNLFIDTYNKIQKDHIAPYAVDIPYLIKLRGNNIISLEEILTP